MYSIKHKIGSSDLNSKGLLRSSAIFDYMQDCSSFHLLSMDFLQEYFKQHNIGMFYTSRQVDILRLPHYTEEITISTGTYECKTIYGFRNTVIYGESGDICIKSYTVGAFIDFATLRPFKMPVEIINKLDIQNKIEMEYLPRKITIPDNNSVVTAEPIPVRKYHIDANGHVNNARYVDIAEEVLPTDFKTSRIRSDYRVPAKLGDVIIPHIYHIDNRIIIDLKVGETSCAAIEFTS